MPKTRSPSVLGSGRVLYLPTARIRPNPMQPRKHFDTGGLQELAGSIRQYGVLQPLTVRKAGGAYELVAGERRLRAARLAGLTEVPCLLADVDEEASGMLALVENLQRRDLDYIEEAEGLQKLMQQYHLSQEQAARRIGKSQSAVANKLRILRHPPSVLQALREHHLTERHARALLRLPDEEERLRVIGLIVQGEWTVAKTEQYIDARLAPKAPQRRELGTFVLRDVRVFPKLHRPSARPRPRGWRQRQPRPAGDRPRNRPDHPHSEVQPTRSRIARPAVGFVHGAAGKNCTVCAFLTI